MAENYDLIFGQSASSQYAWSDSDYQNGWQTVGSTPPTAEQFDALQRKSDTKAKDLNDRLSPLETKAGADGRQAATSYTSGAMLTVDGLPNGWLLECIAPGISGTDAITLPDTLIDGLTIIDGSVTWALRKVATYGGLGYRQPNTEYAVGARVHCRGLVNDLLLQCTTAGTTADTMLDCSANKLGDTITDGTVVWTVEQTQLITTASKALADLTPAVDKVPYFNSQNTAALTDITDAGRAVLAKSSADELLQYVVPNNAGAHNAIYRGKDITADFTSGKMSANIANGTFKNIYIGDYIDVPMTVNGTSIGTVRWRVGECDYFYRHHGTDTTHHVLMVPDDVLNVQTRMNASNDTTGGYCASEMYTTTLPLYVTAIQNAFGTDHVLAHNELLTTAISADAPSAAGAGWTGSASDWGWKTVTANLFNEVMVYGTTAFSSSGFDVGNSKTQVALFHLNQTATIAGYRGNYNDKKWYWLRSIASSSRFCDANGDGDANSNDAAHWDDWSGIRPYFLLR